MAMPKAYRRLMLMMIRDIKEIAGQCDKGMTSSDDGDTLRFHAKWLMIMHDFDEQQAKNERIDIWA